MGNRMRDFFKNPLIGEALLVFAILLIIVLGVFFGQRGTSMVDYKDCENNGGKLVKGLNYTVVCIKSEAIIQLSGQTK